MQEAKADSHNLIFFQDQPLCLEKLYIILKTEHSPLQHPLLYLFLLWDLFVQLLLFIVASTGLVVSTNFSWTKVLYCFFSTFTTPWIVSTTVLPTLSMVCKAISSSPSSKRFLFYSKTATRDTISFLNFLWTALVCSCWTSDLLEDDSAPRGVFKLDNNSSNRWPSSYPFSQSCRIFCQANCAIISLDCGVFLFVCLIQSYRRKYVCCPMYNKGSSIELLKHLGMLDGEFTHYTYVKMQPPWVVCVI